MASASRHNTASYFKKGTSVEISINESGLHGSLYAGTVIRPPSLRKTNSKVLVEYKDLMEHNSSTRRQREETDLINIRPSQPPEKLRSFKKSDNVDAYYNDGWWEGTVTDVLGHGDKYLVFFRRSREELEFKGSELRTHREWVYGKWVPPLEPGQELPQPKDEKVQLSPKVESTIGRIEHNFSSGEHIEVSSDEEGFEGAWFSATVIKKLEGGKYLVEHESLMDEDDDTKHLQEEVDSYHIRPCPPDITIVDRFDVLDQVDAFYNDCWWAGVILKPLHNDKYSVYFSSSDEEMKFKHTDLRVHQEWINGKWVIPPKAEKM